MLGIHTVAAKGNSILFFDGFSFRVGPESAGTNPGPACCCLIADMLGLKTTFIHPCTGVLSA